MRLVGAGPGRGAITDRGLAGDQRRLVGFLRLGDCRRDGFLVLAIDQLGSPARGLETLYLVDRVRQRGRAVDRNAIVVIEHDQLVELPMPGQRDRFLRHPFHQIAVGAEHIGVMVDDLLAEFGDHHFFREREADRGRDALAERPRRGLDALGMEVFRMSGGQRSELAKVLELVERHVAIAGEIQQRIQQHRAVAGRQDEAVAVRPFRLGGVILQKLREQHGGDVGGAHRQAGVAGFGLLDRVHREATDRVGHPGVIDLRHVENPSEMRCLIAVRQLMATEGQGWIAPVFPESKARKRVTGPKSCFAVHSSAAALRWPRLPRKFHDLNACRTAKFLVPRAALPRSAPTA